MNDKMKTSKNKNKEKNGNCNLASGGDVRSNELNYTVKEK